MSVRWSVIVKEEIKNARRLCISGVGNMQKADDGAGPLVIKLLRRKIKKQKSEEILLIDCGEAPENYSGEIRKFQPALTIIIDVCISGKKPGTIHIVKPEKIQYDDFSTHRLPLSMFVKFLEETIPTKVLVIGIEPKNLNFGDGISPEVKKAVEALVWLLCECLKI
ncbi:MAG: hydrogenase maturation peptidase HycI [candidate division WOR-3 bacterium]